MVFYRKYRPQTIDDLDNSSVRETLTAALSHPLADIPHAFLFTGPKGLGKTSTARIVAKTVNCTGRTVKQEQGTKNKGQKENIQSTGFKVQSTESIEPCNQCEQCVSITNGSNMDVIEMDAASNRGIDEIRELKETIKLAPFSACRKVYIIDEVHMLTTEAFNALLKTLEEPPEHALFILCTTELHKVPVTILSRCFHVSFTLATEEELVRSFKRIVKGEHIQVDDDALKLIASMSDGGFRDGVKILEEIASRARNEKITASFISDHYHITGSSDTVTALCRAIANRDVRMGITVLAKAADSGVNTGYILDELLEKVHSTLLFASGVEGKKAEKELSRLTLSELMDISEILAKAASETKYAVIPQLPLELGLLDWAASKISDESESPQTVQNITVSADNSMATLRRQAGNIAKQKAVSGDEKIIKKSLSAKPGVSILDFSADGDITKEWLAEFWTCLIDKLKTDHHTTAGVLRGCLLKSFDRKTLILQTAFKFHKERLDEAKTKAIIENVCKDLTGKPVAITVELVAK